MPSLIILQFEFHVHCTCTVSIPLTTEYRPFVMTAFWKYSQHTEMRPPVFLWAGSYISVFWYYCRFSSFSCECRRQSSSHFGASTEIAVSLIMTIQMLCLYNNNCLFATIISLELLFSTIWIHQSEIFEVIWGHTFLQIHLCYLTEQFNL